MDGTALSALPEPDLGFAFGELSPAELDGVDVPWDFHLPTQAGACWKDFRAPVLLLPSCLLETVLQITEKCLTAIFTILKPDAHQL